MNLDVAEAPVTTVRRNWQVDLAIVERDGQTTAHAYLVGDGPLLNADGRAGRRDSDPETPVVGDEIAVARALRQLADRLLRAAQTDVSLLSAADPPQAQS